MDLIVENIKNTSGMRMARTSVDKNKSSPTSAYEKKQPRYESDEVILSGSKFTDSDLPEAKSGFKESQESGINSEKENIQENQEETGLSEEEIQNFQERVSNNQYNSEKVQNKIVYSLMSLPAFQQIRMMKTKAEQEEEIKNIEQSKELEELKKIQEELTSGQEIDKVLEEAIEYLMKTLIA